MTTNTICSMLRDLDRIRSPAESVLRVQALLTRWLEKLKPARRHQTFSHTLNRYVDEGE